MKSVNRVTLLGNVTRDPELKATANGQAVCTFGLATNRVWRDQSGEKQSLAEYHNLVAWGGLAEFCGQSVRKGKPLYVEGYLKTRSWDGPEGSKIFRTEVVIENLVLLGPREGGDAHHHEIQHAVDHHVEQAMAVREVQLEGEGLPS
jgi:single-strand DNA-binding protein